MKLATRIASLFMMLVAALAGGCRSDSASYMINGPDLSLTLIVDQGYYWDDEWQLGMLTTRQPDCMRRHQLTPAPLKGLKLDVYQSEPGLYILKERSNWYVAEMQKCLLQQFKTPPPLPGDLLGSFEFKDEKLVFNALPKPAAPASAPTPAAPGAAAAEAQTPGAAAATAPAPAPAPAALPPAQPAAAAAATPQVAPAGR